MTDLPASAWGQCSAHTVVGLYSLRCRLMTGHHAPHVADVMWSEEDDAPTAKLPPIRDSIGHRRRPPALAELTDRAELIETMQAELRRELRELREDQGDDDGDRP